MSLSWGTPEPVKPTTDGPIRGLLFALPISLVLIGIIVVLAVALWGAR